MSESALIRQHFRSTPDFVTPPEHETPRSRFLYVLILGAVVALAGTPIDAQTGDRPGGGETPPPAQTPRQGGLLGGAPPPEPPPDAGSASGQLQIGARAPTAPGARPTITAPRVTIAPTLDGLLDDEVWTQALRITQFVQRNPVEGAPATENTEAFIAYDSTNLYFGFYAHYSDRGLIRANRSDRDQFSQDDTISVYFDPFLDQQRAYVFTVNGHGVQGDSIVGGPGGGGGGFSGGGGDGGGGGIPRGDSSWDALFDSAGSLAADGWTAEIAIPFKSLRYPARGNDEPHRWGFQIARSIASKNESVVWAPVTRAIAGFVTQMGALEGMTNLSTSRNLEFLPTFTAIQVGSLDVTHGQFVQDDIHPEGGIGIKYGVTSDLTADFTFNPDFSQIESDQPQIEVNQRFPLFYQELRPFFLEGQEVFSTRGEVNLVHTRTVIDPRYGGKLTGKVGRASIGVLAANDEAPGKVSDPTDPAFDQNAQFFIGRFRYDMYPGSYIGGLVTDREFLDSYSRVGAVDGRFRIGQTDNLEFRLAESRTRGEDGLERAGGTYDFGFSHNGRNFDYNVRHDSVEPGFWTATGFVRRVDTRRTRGQVGYRWWPQSWVTNWGPDLAYERNYDFDGVLQDQGGGVGVNVQFARNVRFNAGAERWMEQYLGVDFWKSRRQLSGQVGTSRRIAFGGSFNWGDQIRFIAVPYLGRARDGRFFVSVLPLSRLRSSLQVSFSQLVDPRDDSEVFDVKILRSQTTYQFTERLLLRSILEYNTLEKAFDANLLLTYRVNAGTVFFVGYDDHYRQGNQLDGLLFPTDEFRQTNRAFFTKLSYLFRY